MSLSDDIKAAALAEGFSAAGITRAEFLRDEAGYYQEWLGRGQAADMAYLSANCEKRFDVSRLVPGAGSVLVVLLDYRTHVERPSSYKIARYALLEDYHYVVKQKLGRVLDRFPSLRLPSQQIFCDSAPVLERSLARRAGLGHPGKNSLLINPSIGSFFFIGELVLPAELGCDSPLGGSPCDGCNRCAAACPAGAITPGRGVDARKCLSYITIESRRDISACEEVRRTRTLFGCDVCQEVCPWNRRAAANPSPALSPLPYASWTDDRWEAMTKGDFKKCMKYSPLARAGYEKIRATIDFIGPKKG